MENITNEKKNDKPSPPKLVYDQELSEEKCSQLISLIKSHFIPEEILYRIRPELKASYISRIDKNLPEDTIIKIPLEKMNEEERLLEAYLCKSNLYNDIPPLTTYISIMLEKLNDPSDKKTLDDILDISIANYYASKIRLYSEDASKDEEDEEFDKKLIEQNKNRVPLSEEEAKKELAELQEFPMFMTELPEHPENNPYLEQLQSLQYEGNADEVGLELLNSSNEYLEKYLKNKKFHDLKESMIDICNAIEHCENDPTCDYIKFELYLHRGKMQVMVKNWRYAIDDLSEAIKFIPSMKKEDYDKNLKNNKIDDAFLKLIESCFQLKLFKRAKEIIKERKKSDNKQNLQKYIDYEKKING